MADFSKHTEVNVRFDQDVHSVTVQGGAYSPSINITTKGSDTVDLRFKDVDELRNFIALVITAAHNNAWHNEYNSNYAYNGDKTLITLDDLKMWEMSHSEHEANVAAYKAEQDMAAIKANLDGNTAVGS